MKGVCSMSVDREGADLALDRYVFPAVFEPGESDCYAVTFPDLPGCVTQGSTIAGALAMGREALELHLYGMEEDGEAIPEPTPLDQISVDAPTYSSPVEVWMPPVRDEMAKRVSPGAIRKAQKTLAGVAKNAGVDNEADVQSLVDDVRYKKGILIRNTK